MGIDMVNGAEIHILESHRSTNVHSKELGLAAGKPSSRL